MSEPTQMEPKNKNRSVDDYDSDEALQKALMVDNLTEESSPRSPKLVMQVGKEEDRPTCKMPKHSDWVLPCYDPATTEEQSAEEELRRLQVLQSYMILDADPEEAFEGLTAMASRTFKVPIALVSLVDLGRQWFMSSCGVGDVRETPRRVAFCAHAILSMKDIFIVPDATKDFRFESNGLVTGPPNIRFYAGAPLISPEGYKMGTFCIIDTKTHPDGLSAEQEELLKDLAGKTVKKMVDRRSRLEKRGLSPHLRRGRRRKPQVA